MQTQASCRMGRRIGRLVLLCGLVVAALAAMPSVRAAADSTPPVGHVWVINLENEPGSATFQDTTDDPYMARVLPGMGALLTQYYAVGHNSLDNYLAEVSGQAPNSASQDDCQSGEWTPDPPPIDSNGQAVGSGCYFPSNVHSLADQLDPGHSDQAGVTWKGYMEDMGLNAVDDGGIRCAYFTGNGQGGAESDDRYVQKHNPFVYFHSLRDNASYCQAHVGPLGDLRSDLQDVATTPKFSFITPGLVNDGHESSQPAFGQITDRWLAHYIPMIMASPAYRQDGMIVLTSDETGLGDSSACCNEQPGPNYPVPGGIGAGPGGGQTAAVVLSPFISPGTVVDPSSGSGCTPVTCTGPGFYNHYSLLRTLEDIFKTKGGTDSTGRYLGFAGSSSTYPGPGSFGCEVFTAYAPCEKGQAASQPTPSPPPGGPAGRAQPADGSSTWLNPGPQGNDLTGVDCAGGDACVAVGAVGTALTSGDGGQTWEVRRTGTARNLGGVSCTGSTCLAVGDGGTVLRSTDGGATWTSSVVAAAGGADLTGITCRADGLCLAVGAGSTILRSLDGGVTWSKAPPGLDGQPLTGVACVPGQPVASTSCFATGPFTEIGTTPAHAALKSSDGGASWSPFLPPQSGGTALRLRSITCPSSSLCFAAGDKGNVTWSQDGGSTWGPTSFGTPDDSDLYLGVACPDASSSFTCFGVGEHYHLSFAQGNPPDGGGVMRTADGGQTFAGVGPGVREGLHSASCGQTGCVAVGARGVIVRSTDGGNTWSQVSRETESALTAVSCPERSRTREKERVSWTRSASATPSAACAPMPAPPARRASRRATTGRSSGPRTASATGRSKPRTPTPPRRRRPGGPSASTESPAPRPRTAWPLGPTGRSWRPPTGTRGRRSPQVLPKPCAR